MRRNLDVCLLFSPLLFVLVTLCAEPGLADLYEWTDDDGRVHYTNEPRPGANPVGLAPIALPPEGEEVESGEATSDEATATDTLRRERLKRQRAERWVDRQDEFPTGDPSAAWDEPTPEQPDKPAAPARNNSQDRDRQCQAQHGMSCLQFEAWLQVNGIDCAVGPTGEACRSQAKIDLHKKARDKARERLEREDADRAARWSPGVE